MSTPDSNSSYVDRANQAIFNAFETATRTAVAVVETVVPGAHDFVEQGTETIGRFVTPIAANPIVRHATKIPGLTWIMASLGQVDEDKVKADVEALRLQYPTETPRQLTQRIISDIAVKAGGIGLVTNFVPPLALALFAVDLAAINTLQAEMIYRIAAVYGFSVDEPARRGEVLAIFGLSSGGSGVLKGGLSIIEIIPVVGTMVGVTSNAALIYSLGQIACQFYENKLRRAAQQRTPIPVNIEVLDDNPDDVL